MTQEKRRLDLTEIVRQQGFVPSPVLAQQLAVSQSTIRRDLDSLEESGTLRRTHGGVFYVGPSPRVPHFEQQQQQQWESKKQIARHANLLIKDGDTILLDGGSTTYELAQLLVGRPLQVVTNSLPVATLFTGNSTDLVILGGYVHGRTAVSIGPYANNMLSELNVETAFLSVAGINKHGCYNSNLLLVETERAMMQSADRVVILADSSKFGHSSLAHMCHLDDVDVLIVGADLSSDWREVIAGHDVELILATAEDQAEVKATSEAGLRTEDKTS